MSDLQPSAGERSLAPLIAVAAAGAEDAARGLSELTGRPIRVEATGVHFGAVARLLDLVGGPETAVAGVYLAIGGAVRGHVMLLFTVEEANRLVDQLLELPPGTTRWLDAMATSALGEVGNIASAAFLNRLGDAAGVQIHPAPPEVVVDLAAALLDSVLVAVAAEGGDLVVIETVITEMDRAVRGFMLLTPEATSLAALLDRLEPAA